MDDIKSFKAEHKKTLNTVVCTNRQQQKKIDQLKKMT